MPFYQFLCKTGPFSHVKVTCFFVISDKIPSVVRQWTMCITKFCFKAFMQSEILAGMTVLAYARFRPEAMMCLIFRCICGTRLFVYKNNIGNTFVEAICHSVSSYSEMVPFSIVKATCCFAISDKIPSVRRQWTTCIVKF